MSGSMISGIIISIAAYYGLARLTYMVVEDLLPSEDAAYVASVFFPITWVIGLIIFLLTLPIKFYRGVRDIILDLIGKLVDGAYDMAEQLKRGSK